MAGRGLPCAPATSSEPTSRTVDLRDQEMPLRAVSSGGAEQTDSVRARASSGVWAMSYFPPTSGAPRSEGEHNSLRAAVSLLLRNAVLILTIISGRPEKCSYLPLGPIAADTKGP